MPDTEDNIKAELHTVIAIAASVKAVNIKALTRRINEGKALTADHITTHISTHAEIQLGAWAEEALRAENSPSTAMRWVRTQAQNEVFKGDREASPLQQAMNQIRNRHYISFILRANEMLGD